MGHLNLKELKELIDLVSEKGFAEFELERQGFRIRITRFQELAPAQPEVTPTTARSAQASSAEGPSSEQDTGAASTSGTATSAAPPVEVPQPEAGLHTITSPIVGTFYRSAAPTSEPFVSVGDRVEPDSVVCIIEAMKLMNEIQADVAGEIVTVYPQNAQAVEYGEPLFVVKIRG
jgi:acetyl-CoA carboxylase biotin carboxyl carrier protein